MESNTFQLEITTPRKKIAFDDVKSCSIPGKNGGFQILYNHAPIMSELAIGDVKIETSRETTHFATSGGFMEASNNKIVLLLETCETASEIDLDRASKAIERAKKRLHERTEGLDVERAEFALARALNRMKVVKK